MSYFLLYTKELVLFKLTFFISQESEFERLSKNYAPSVTAWETSLIDSMEQVNQPTNLYDYNTILEMCTGDEYFTGLSTLLIVIENLLKISGSRHFIAWRGTNSSILIPGSSDRSGKNRKILIKYFYLQMSIQVVVYYLSMLCNWYLNKMLV